MENQIQITNYTQYKTELDKQLRETAEGFVRIGYLLKLARDTDILNGSGYANVNEFAKKEYNLDKSMVSRFININDRFAEDGNSQYLKEQYRGFGYAKLAIMLQLPDEINEELTPDFSKAEIQAIKDEVDAEGKISDIENLLDGEAHAELENNLHKALYQLLEDMPELYLKLHECLNDFEHMGDDRGYIKIFEILAPDGEKVYSIRIQGIGRIMMFLNENAECVTLTNVRSGEKEQFQKKDLSYYIDCIITSEHDTAEKEWEATYGKEFPKKEEVAPVQPKKESKVQKAPEKPKQAAGVKTEEQKYSEQQAKIDRETKKKLQEMEDAKKMEVLPSERPKPIHQIKLGKTFFADAAAGIKTFTLRKNDRNYQVGDILEKQEYDNGEYTGRALRQEVVYKLEDYTGLADGYCILGVKNLEMVEG